MEEIKDKIFNSLSVIYPLSEEDFNLFFTYFKHKRYKKGDEILSFGQIENRTSRVISGIVHRTIIIDNEIFTVDIALSGMHMNNLKSYIEESPSLEVQTAVTDVDIIYIEKETCEKLRRENHTFCNLYSKIRDNNYLERHKRLYILQIKNANKRFEVFMNTNKNANRYLKEAPQHIIARYLNVTPETLSRVKKEYFQ